MEKDLEQTKGRAALATGTERKDEFPPEVMERFASLRAELRWFYERKVNVNCRPTKKGFQLSFTHR